MTLLYTVWLCWGIVWAAGVRLGVRDVTKSLTLQWAMAGVAFILAPVLTIYTIWQALTEG